MLVAAIDLQFRTHRPAQLALWQHALDGLLQNRLRLAVQQAAKLFLAQPARKARVAAIKLLLALQPGQADLLRVDDDHVVAHIDVRHILGVQLAAQQIGGLGRQTPQRLTAGIHYIPFAGNVFPARNKGAHLSPAFKKTCPASHYEKANRLNKTSRNTLAPTQNAHGPNFYPRPNNSVRVRTAGAGPLRALALPNPLAVQRTQQPVACSSRPP